MLRAPAGMRARACGAVLRAGLVVGACVACAWPAPSAAQLQVSGQIEADAEAFKSDVQNAGFSQVVVLEPGGTHTVK